MNKVSLPPWFGAHVKLGQPPGNGSPINGSIQPWSPMVMVLVWFSYGLVWYALVWFQITENKTKRIVKKKEKYFVKLRKKEN